MSFASVLEFFGRADLPGALLSAIFAGIAALLGGKWATRNAVAKLKGERAFERRLKWHEQVVQVLGELAGALHALAGAAKADDDDDINEHFASLKAAFLKLQDAARDVEMYATRKSYRRLDLAIRRIANLSQGLITEAGTYAGPDESSRLFSESADTIEAAATSLAADVRKLLGLEPLFTWRERVAMRLQHRTLKQRQWLATRMQALRRRLSWTREPLPADGDSPK